MTMEPSSGVVTVVAPGSADDPFSANNPNNDLAGQFSDDVMQQIQTMTPSPAPVVSQPVVPNSPVSAQPTQPQPASPAQPLQGIDIKALFESPEAKSFIDSQVLTRVSAATSTLQKQNNDLVKSLDTVRGELTQAQQAQRATERAQALASLSTSERAAAQERWKAEDLLAEVQVKEGKLREYHQVLEASRLYAQFSQFGLTEEELLACSSIEDMESLAKDKKIDFLENGGTLATPASPTGAKKAPAATSMAPDMASAPAAPAPNGGMLTQSGVNNMSQNVKSLFGATGQFVEFSN